MSRPSRTSQPAPTCPAAMPQRRACRPSAHAALALNESVRAKPHTGERRKALPHRTRLLFGLLCLAALAATAGAQDMPQAQAERHLIGYTSEFIGRSWATKRVLPVYPAEDIAADVQGVVEVFVGINNDGQVVKVRVPTGLDAHLRRAAVGAARLWRFRPFVNRMGPGELSIFRLSFNFVIEDGVGRGELYSPPYDTPQHRRMRGASPRDRNEWLSWEDATAEAAGAANN